MARTAGDYQTNPTRAYKEDWTFFHAQVDIGASGAPTLSSDSDPGISISRNSTGSYALTYPAFPSGSCALVEVFAIKSDGIIACPASAISTTAGTATIKTFNATSTEADPASGDILGIRISGRVTHAK